MSQSIADGSARTFKAGITAYLEFNHAHDVTPLLPSAEDIVLYATYLGHSRSISTVKVYLAAVRHHLMSHAAPTDCMHSTRLAAVLRRIGRNKRPVESPKGRITMADLRVLHQYVTRSNYSAQDGAMLWACVTTSFYGLLRASEFLAPDAVHVEADQILVWWSMSIEATQATICLKRTKTSQDGHGGTVLLLPTGDALCPLAALQRLRSLTKTPASSQQPVFCFQSGKHLTREEFTKTLRHALQTTTVSSHSLRIGGATHMVSLGASEAQIRRAGRWCSSASDRYVRHAAGMPTLQH